MLIPQYSIRWLLMLTAACAAVFSVFGLAVRGSPWAQGVSIAVVALVVVLLVHALLFTLLWVFSALASGPLRSGTGFGRSPFAGDPTCPVCRGHTGPHDPDFPSVGHGAAGSEGHDAAGSEGRCAAPPNGQADDKEKPATPILLE